MTITTYKDRTKHHQEITWVIFVFVGDISAHTAGAQYQSCVEHAQSLENNNTGKKEL